jgi:hypothetical protein
MLLMQHVYSEWTKWVPSHFSDGTMLTVNFSLPRFAAHLWLASGPYRQLLGEMFNPGHIFNDVAEYLLCPNRNLTSLISEFAAEFRPFTIGVQIRDVKATTQVSDCFLE